MEPITYILIAFIVWLLNAYGKDVVTLAKKEVQHWFRYAVVDKNILIFGPHESGKTSLILFLEHGRPFKLVEGKRIEPEPTGAGAIIDRAVNLSKKRLKSQKAIIPKDIGGEKVWTHLWHELINDTDPNGIIYMVDGRKQDKEFKEDCERFFTDVLSKYKSRKGNLLATHIFINFSDVWSQNNRQRIVRKENLVRHFFETMLMKQEYSRLSHLRFNVSSIQLSPDLNFWRKAESALHKFAADLID